MTAHNDRQTESSILPELEHLLLRAARRRAAPRLRRRRWVLATVSASLVLVGGAAAATGVVHIADGRTSKGTYSIDSRPVPSNVTAQELEGSICLQLRYNEGAPAYSCGARPSAEEPFGLVIADSLAGSQQRVIYGFVSSQIFRVRVLGEADGHADALTEVKAGLPGRFFSVIVPNQGRIALVGYDAVGKERARVGSLAQPAHPPRSHDEAVAQGDPAGFAPTVAPPTSFSYQGKSITPSEASQLGLTCAQNREGVHCYESLPAMNADQQDHLEGRGSPPSP